MSIKAKLDGIEFELETEADLRAFLAAAKNGTVATEEGLETLIQKMRRLYEKVSSKPHQKAVIEALASAGPSGMTDVDLRVALSMTSNNVLGGVVAGIGKNARAVGLRAEQVLTVQPLKAADANYLYKLSPDMRDLVSGSGQG